MVHSICFSDTALLTHCGLVTPYCDMGASSTLTQVMTCCLMAPSHYLNQCWLIIKGLMWDSSDSNFTRGTPDISPSIELKTTSLTLLRLHPHLSVAIESTHWDRNKMAAIFQTTFSNAFSWMKMYKFQLRFHWSLFLRVQLAIFQHWFR